MKSCDIFLFILTLAFGAKAELTAFDQRVNDSAELWTLTHSRWLQGETAGWFRPTSDTPDADLRYPGYKNSPQVSFLGFRIYEIVLKFNAGNMNGITISLYNRGDAGELSKTQFAAQVSAIDDAIALWSGQKGALKPPQKLKSNMEVDSKTWALTNILVEKYNLQAKKEKKAIINPVNNYVINVEDIYNSMDPGTLRRTRCERDQVAFRNFLADIEKCVDQGIPLAWSVMLGIVKETPELPQARGGHMRIISGYNKTTKEILYSDSWGVGERKVMPFEDAWTITAGLYSLDPRY